MFNGEKLIYTEDELPQRSQEWLDMKSHTIGGSEVGTMLGLIDTPKNLWGRKTGALPPKKPTPAMLKGTEMEPEALAEAKKQIGSDNIIPYFVIHPKYSYISVSFDGVNLDDKYILELKCPYREKNFITVLENGIQGYYYPQVQWQLFVAKETWGITKGYFFSYFPQGANFTDPLTFKQKSATSCLLEINYNESYCEAMLYVAKNFHKFIEHEYWDDKEYKEVLNEFQRRTRTN